MKKLFFLFVVSFFSSSGLLHGHEEWDQESLDEIFCSCRKSFQQDESGKTRLNFDRVWNFNDRAYLLNDLEQWVPLSPNIARDIHQFLEELARRGKCPKEHQGVYLDKNVYEEGLWCCRGLYKGDLCPYHIDRQFPDGIPKGSK